MTPALHACKDCKIDADHGDVQWFAEKCGLTIKEAHVKVQRVISLACRNNPTRRVRSRTRRTHRR